MPFAYHVLSTSVTEILSYPAHRMTDRTTDHITVPTLAVISIYVLGTRYTWLTDTTVPCRLCGLGF